MKKNPYAFTGHEGVAMHVNLMKLYHKHNMSNKYLTTGSLQPLCGGKYFWYICD
jgi:hypothetical protein